MWHPPTQQQPEEMQRKQLLIAKPRKNRREIPVLRAQRIIYRPLVWTADGRLHPAVTRTPRSTDGSTKSKYPSSDEEQPRAVPPNTSAREEWLLAPSWTEPPATGSEHPPSREETTMTQAQEQTPQHQMMTTRTSLPSARQQTTALRPQTFDHCVRAPLGATDVPPRAAARNPLRRPRHMCLHYHRRPWSRARGLQTTRAGSATTDSPIVDQQAQRGSVSTQSHNHLRIPSPHQWRQGLSKGVQKGFKPKGFGLTPPFTPP